MAHIGTLCCILPKYISLKRSHPLWAYKGIFLYIIYLLHEHNMNHLFHLHWSNYINIMKSSINEPHNITFCVRLSPDNFFSQSSSRNIIPSMWEVTFHTHKNERNVSLIRGWNIPLQVVLHMQWVTKKNSLKNCSKSSLYIQIFVSQGHPDIEAGNSD